MLKAYITFDRGEKYRTATAGELQANVEVSCLTTCVHVLHSRPKTLEATCQANSSFDIPGHSFRKFYRNSDRFHESDLVVLPFKLGLQTAQP